MLAVDPEIAELAGRPTELHVYPGAPHGVMSFSHTAFAKRFAAGIEHWIGRQLQVASVS